MRHRDRASRTGPQVSPAIMLTCALAAVTATAGTSSTTSLPTFSSTVDVVNLNVSVTDAKDHYVTGLGEGDFRVFEDGVPQKLCVFTQEHLPISLAILIDSSLSMQPNLGAVKAAAMRLVRELGKGDAAEIVQFNHKFSVLQDFTNDQSLLEKAISSIRADGATGVYNALYFTLKDARFRGKPDELTRQAIVVLTDGEDTSSLVSDDQVLQLAKKSNVTIFTINLQQPRPNLVDTAAPDRAAYFLTALSRETGGRSYSPTSLSQIDGVYEKIADELRTQYALGYVSSNSQQDGKWRHIAIETTQANLMLRHKQGYYASALRALRSALDAAARAAGTSLPHRPDGTPAQ